MTSWPEFIFMTVATTSCEPSSDREKVSEHQPLYGSSHCTLLTSLQPSVYAGRAAPGDRGGGGG